MLITQRIYLDPKNDIAFRRLFGRPSHKEITISLLNSVLNFTGSDCITDITHLSTHLLPESIELRESIVDILCEDQRGQQYIVELQILKPLNFDKRVLYYASKTYVSQMLKGDDYPKLKKVYLVGILDHVMFSHTQRYKTEHTILDKVDYNQTFKDFEFHIIELPKFTKTEEECVTTEDKWIYFFKNAEKIDHIPSRVTESAIKQAYDLMAQFNWSREEMDLYERSILAVQDLHAIEAQARKDGWEKGVEEGFGEGKAKGEREMQIKITKNMIQQGLSVENIANATGLCIEDIKKEDFN